MTHLSHSSYYCGASHLAEGREVQDYAAKRIISLGDTDALALSLSDGHGSPQHSRSAIGSRMAVECCLDVLSEFASQLCCTDCGGTLRHGQGDEYGGPCENLVREMLGCIMKRWSYKVLEHFREAPLLGLIPGARAYGCTLLGAFVSERFWLVFQLGDGACVCLDNCGAPFRPLPDDSRCRGNVTTSMCSHGAEDFRFCCGTELPSAIMLCSDGVENSFVNREELGTNFLVPLIAEIYREGMAAAEEDIARSLPLLSERYSRDDMSVAFWTTKENALTLGPVLEAINATCRSAERQALEHDLAGCTADIVRMESEIAEIEALCADNDGEDMCSEIVRKQAVLDTLRRRELELREDLQYLEESMNEN